MFKKPEASACFFLIFLGDGNAPWFLDGGDPSQVPRLHVKLQFHSEFSSGKWWVSGWKTILSYWVSVTFQGL